MEAKDFLEEIDYYNTNVDGEQFEDLEIYTLADMLEVYHQRKLKLLGISGVSKSFKTELEMHEIATEKYQEHNFGDAKYDGFMDCYRMLVKETKNNTSLSK
jgi:hypothetical protein